MRRWVFLFLFVFGGAFRATWLYLKGNLRVELAYINVFDILVWGFGFVSYGKMYVLFKRTGRKWINRRRQRDV